MDPSAGSATPSCKLHCIAESDYPAWNDPISNIRGDLVAEMDAKGWDGTGMLKWLEDDIEKLKANHLSEDECVKWVEDNLM